jgi:hypothetical protein
VQDLVLVLVPGGGGAVGVDYEGPAESMDHDLVVVCDTRSHTVGRCSSKEDWLMSVT